MAISDDSGSIETRDEGIRSCRRASHRALKRGSAETHARIAGVLGVPDRPKTIMLRTAMRNAHHQVVCAQVAQGRPQDRIDSPPMRTSLTGRKL
jgi:hypothetical protein